MGKKKRILRGKEKISSDGLELWVLSRHYSVDVALRLDREMDFYELGLLRGRRDERGYACLV